MTIGKDFHCHSHSTLQCKVYTEIHSEILCSAEVGIKCFRVFEVLSQTGMFIKIKSSTPQLSFVEHFREFVVFRIAREFWAFQIPTFEIMGNFGMKRTEKHLQARKNVLKITENSKKQQILEVVWRINVWFCLKHPVIIIAQQVPIPTSVLIRNCFRY